MKIKFNVLINELLNFLQLKKGASVIYKTSVKYKW